MENFKTLIQEQATALKKDIAELVDEIKIIELQLEDLKERKSQAFKVLRGIEKRLAEKK